MKSVKISELSEAAHECLKNKQFMSKSVAKKILNISELRACPELISGNALKINN